jgi:uncharacterized CHY-type Zn-finger protein
MIGIKVTKLDDVSCFKCRSNTEVSEITIYNKMEQGSGINLCKICQRELAETLMKKK